MRTNGRFVDASCLPGPQTPAGLFNISSSDDPEESEVELRTNGRFVDALRLPGVGVGVGLGVGVGVGVGVTVNI